MEANNSLENQVKTLQRQFGGMAKLVKDLKCTVESLEQKVSQRENHEIQEIIDTQQVLDEIIVAFSDALRRIEKEMQEIASKKIGDKVPNDIIEKDKNREVKNRRRCRYYNRGFCKQIQCGYFHADEICRTYLETQRCS